PSTDSACDTRAPACLTVPHSAPPAEQLHTPRRLQHIASPRTSRCRFAPGRKHCRREQVTPQERHTRHPQSEIRYLSSILRLGLWGGILQHFRSQFPRFVSQFGGPFELEFFRRLTHFRLEFCNQFRDL